MSTSEPPPADTTQTSPTDSTSPIASSSSGPGLGSSDPAASTADAGTGGTSADASTAIPIDETPRPEVNAEAGTELVTVDVGAKHQTFEGWGTSLCWWANHVGGWSEEARELVVDAVVDAEHGLGYNIFRYNIGGGENPAHDHMDRFRDMPGFQDAEGNWHWDADANQRAILLSIQEQGSSTIFEAFSNSPPYWMTTSGCASGSGDGNNNLKEDSYPAFADYLTEVVSHYRDEYGVDFRTLEPLNEPNANWWKADGSQEGCHFSPANQERIIQEVAASLAAKGLSETLVSASDENSMDDALKNIGAFSDETLDVVGQLNVHSYAGSRRAELRALADDLGKRLWQSESGPLGQNISDDTEAALFMAGRIIADLRDLKAEAWIDWQSGDPSRSWASFTLDDDAETYEPLKRFYMHAAFSRYIRPGAVFVEIDDSDMVAAVNEDGATLAVVMRNPDAQGSRRFTFDVTSLPSVGTEAQVYLTSRTQDLEPQDPIAIEGYSLVIEAPAYSVLTLVVPIH